MNNKRLLKDYIDNLNDDGTLFDESEDFEDDDDETDDDECCANWGCY